MTPLGLLLLASLALLLRQTIDDAIGNDVRLCLEMLFPLSGGHPALGLAAAFEAGGINTDRPVITSCGSGVTACGLALALAILGNEKTFVYDGSWSEWGASDAPVETGAAQKS